MSVPAGNTATASDFPVVGKKKKKKGKRQAEQVYREISGRILHARRPNVAADRKTGFSKEEVPQTVIKTRKCPGFFCRCFLQCRPAGKYSKQVGWRMQTGSQTICGGSCWQAWSTPARQAAPCLALFTHSRVAACCGTPSCSWVSQHWRCILLCVGNKQTCFSYVGVTSVSANNPAYF